MQAPTDLVARLDRQRDNIAALRATLPWNCADEEDQRALLVWFQAERRYLETFCREAVMTIIPGLEEVPAKAPRAEKLTNVKPGKRSGSLRELGQALRDLGDFCQREALPLVARLEAGMARIEACELSREGDAEHDRLLAYWLKLRAQLREHLLVVWRLAVVAREEYQGLDATRREEALGIWGPLQGEWAHDYSPLINRSWPTRQLRDLDRRAAEQGVVDLTDPFGRGKVIKPKGTKR